MESVSVVQFRSHGAHRSGGIVELALYRIDVCPLEGGLSSREAQITKSLRLLDRDQTQILYGLFFELSPVELIPGTPFF